LGQQVAEPPAGPLQTKLARLTPQQVQQQGAGGRCVGRLRGKRRACARAPVG
jgi:hypothetical protein